jgi:uncharacterized membrane protein YeaQ/YmgE (transglycosylase-associated protein family)
MGLVFLIVIGGMLGWLAAIVTRAESAPARARNILAGIAGALVTGLVINPLIGAANLLEASTTSTRLLIALAGSAVLLCLSICGATGSSASPIPPSTRFQQGSGYNEPSPQPKGR